MICSNDSEFEEATKQARMHFILCSAEAELKLNQQCMFNNIISETILANEALSLDLVFKSKVTEKTDTEKVL